MKSYNEKLRRIFSIKNFGYFISNLFCFYIINNRIEQRWDKQVKVGQKNMNVGWNMEFKFVCKEGEEIQEVKFKEDINVGNVGVKGFEFSFFQRQIEDGNKYLEVGEDDKDYV